MITLGTPNGKLLVDKCPCKYKHKPISILPYLKDLQLGPEALRLVYDHLSNSLPNDKAYCCIVFSIVHIMSLKRYITTVKKPF